MIYVSEDQLNQVEYLIDQSVQGNHVLFDPQLVRSVFKDYGSEIDEQEAYEVEHHIEKLIDTKTLDEKKAYIDQLDSATLSLVVRTYFNIIENNIYENLEVTH